LKPKGRILFYFIVLLGSIGLISVILKNPASLLYYLIGTSFAVALLFWVMRNLTPGTAGSRSEYRAFVKAARRSQKRYKNDWQKGKSRKPKHALRRNASHLTVIEGKKGKKKSGALH